MTDPQERMDAEDETEAAMGEVGSAPPEPTPAPLVAASEPATTEESPADPVVTSVPPAVAAGPRPYAIVETGGKQYRVSVGDRLAVEKLPVEAGSDLTFDRVLLLGGDGATRVGTPTVAGAAVQARVEEQFRDAKIIVFKYKAKKRYRRRQGHRQSLTRLTITGITA